ncbi:MAG TPA: SCP2 sterol-binding domain-containing protein [Rhodocyclaceae bacterium]|nr:SCP2 sterol-binding domain-containing protein [Rhodocyclaceae bacterium]
MLPTQPVLFALNHLLGQSGWARDRLKDFAGRSARLGVGPMGLHLAISDDGLFVAAAGEAASDVTINLPADAPLRFMRGGVAEVMKGAQVTGAADLADALGFVLRNLRWDAEEDLSKWVGDIAAHRLVRGAESVVAWQKDAAQRFAENLGEYLTYENPQLVRKAELDSFATEVAELAAALDKVEKRLK